VSNLQGTNEGAYTVEVGASNVVWGTAPAYLTVTQPPTITRQPASQMVLAGASVGFSVEAAGRTPMGFLWQRDGVFLATNFAANGSNAYTVPMAQVGQVGLYSVVITNVDAPGGVPSQAAALSVITERPANVSVEAGSPASLRVTVRSPGGVTLAYQWHLNGAVLPGQTNAVLSLAAVGSGDGGTYSVTITDGLGAQAVLTAVLTVTVSQAIHLSEPRLLPGVGFQFGLTGLANASYTVEAASHLTNWSSVATLAYTNGVMRFVVPAATNANRRFYRVRLGP
jgi:hypothetical protein